MRKVYLSLVAGLLATATSFGQVLFGVQGSGQMTNISISGVDAQGLDFGSLFKNRVGFRAGLMADIPITDRLSVRPQLMYSSKGSKIDFRPFVAAFAGGFGGPAIDPNSLPDSLVFNTANNYIEMPIQLMYGLDAGPGRVVLGAGPYLGYLIGGSVNGKSATISPDAKRFDYGATLSAGYELPMGLTISAYYSHGFANLAGEPDPNAQPIGEDFDLSAATASGSVTNRAFGLTLGFFFGTGN